MKSKIENKEDAYSNLVFEKIIIGMVKRHRKYCNENITTRKKKH